MQAGDIQKEGHLSFLLAAMFEKKKMYASAIKYYSNYSRCAHLQKDKVGLSLAMNRIGVNHFHLGRLDESVHAHQQSRLLSE